MTFRINSTKCRGFDEQAAEVVSTRSRRSAGALLLAVAGIALISCAGKNAALVDRMDRREMETKSEIEALNNSLNATYDRESAITERLLDVEKINLQFRRDVEKLRAQLAAVMQEVESRPWQVEPPPAKPTDVPGLYQAARASYGDHNYEDALGQFSEVIEMSPYGELADNAQYWMGECHFGMEQWNPALTEFTKVFAYPTSSKADDAQLMIARCHLNLGDRNRALSAFQKLLDEYPQSEYIQTAESEMRVLQ